VLGDLEGSVLVLGDLEGSADAHELPQMPTNYQ